MVSINELEGIYLLSGLDQPMLEKIGAITELRQRKDREVIFQEGDRAKNFYMLKKGKILLEVEVSPMIIISLGSIKSGYSFGWSGLLPGSNHTSYAVCTEPCDVLTVPGNPFLELLKQDHTMGYRVMEATMRILKNRLERRTGQFLKVMSKHPDIQKLLGL